MKNRLQTLDEVKKALADQDRQLRAAFEAMPRGRTLVITAATLRAIAERSEAWRPRAVAKIAATSRGVRC